MLISRPSKALLSKMSDPSLSTPNFLPVLSEILNFFHSNWKVFDQNRQNFVNLVQICQVGEKICLLLSKKLKFRMGALKGTILVESCQKLTGKIGKLSKHLKIQLCK
jgi:hypothetical protein